MVGTAHAASDDRLTCEKCHGFYAVESPADGSGPRVRCNACGHIREQAIAPVQKKEEEGKWTVIGPDGRTMTFGSWEKLVESRHPPAGAGSASKLPGAHPEEKKLSATALLDVTPTPVLPTLTLTDLDSNPNLPVARTSTAGALGKSLTKSKPPEWAPVKAKQETPKAAEPPLVTKLAPAALEEDEPAPLSLRDAIPEDDEPAPLSLRDAIPEEDETSPLSLRDAIPDEDDASDPHEMVSLNDVVLIGAEDSIVDSTPHPPARGALHTLPPTPSKKGDAAPPPTITVEEERRQAEAKDEKTAKVDPKTAAGKLDAKKAPEKKGAVSVVAKKSETRSEPKDARKPAASARTGASEDAPTRGWLLPSLAVAVVAVVIWRVMAGSPAKTETPVQSTPEPTVATATATPEPTATATETAQQPEPTVVAATSATPADTTATATPTPSVIATTTATAAAEKKAAPTTAPGDTDTPAAPEKKAAPAETGLSMSDLLDRAGSARRSGDLATARELYERVVRQNPGNVEANGGLGDVARAQGDLAAAKVSYERALAASPSYGPAQLGLADTEWDLGNHSGAQRRYAQIVEQLRNRAPERAKQRGAATTE